MRAKALGFLARSSLIPCWLEGSGSTWTRTRAWDLMGNVKPLYTPGVVLPHCSASGHPPESQGTTTPPPGSGAEQVDLPPSSPPLCLQILSGTASRTRRSGRTGSRCLPWRKVQCLPWRKVSRAGQVYGGSDSDVSPDSRLRASAQPEDPPPQVLPDCNSFSWQLVLS